MFYQYKEERKNILQSVHKKQAHNSLLIKNNYCVHSMHTIRGVEGERGGSAPLLRITWGAAPFGDISEVKDYLSNTNVSRKC